MQIAGFIAPQRVGPDAGIGSLFRRFKVPVIPGRSTLMRSRFVRAECVIQRVHGLQLKFTALKQLRFVETMVLL